MVMCQLQRCIGRVMFMFVLLGWCCVEPVSSQDGAGSIVGEVLDGMTGVPLVGAIVTLNDDEVGISTDENGHFFLEQQRTGAISVRVDHDGYITRVEPVSINKNTVSFVHFYMSSMDLLLDELKVVTQREREKEGPGLGDIRPTEAESSLTVMKLMAARIPSLTVLGGTYSAAGTPEIRIRGQGSMTVSNTPAIYLDGVRINSQVLMETFAGDVERIRVLKGPSAVSMYPDAVNGVILVDTKRR